MPFFFIRPEFRPSPLIGCVFVNNIRFSQKNGINYPSHTNEKKKANCVKIAAALLTPFSSIDTQKKTARSYLNGQKLQRPVHTRPPNIGSSAPSVVFMGVKVFHPKIFFFCLFIYFVGVFLVEIYLTVLCKLLTAYILPNIYIIYQVNVVAFFLCPSRSRSIHG